MQNVNIFKACVHAFIINIITLADLPFVKHMSDMKLKRSALVKLQFNWSFSLQNLFWVSARLFVLFCFG